MNNNSRVIYLQIKPARGAPMQPENAVEAVAGRGLSNDSQFGRSKRQVLVIERETLDEFGLPVGDVRENITVEGISLAGLPAGTLMQAGRALLEVTMDCTPCKFIESKRARGSGIRWRVDVVRCSRWSRVARSGWEMKCELSPEVSFFDGEKKN